MELNILIGLQQLPSSSLIPHSNSGSGSESSQF